MTGPPSPAGFDKSDHPRGQSDNAGKFKRKPIPTPPPPGRRGPAPAATSDIPLARPPTGAWDEVMAAARAQTSEIPLAVYDALVVVADWLRETAQDDQRDALLSMRVEGPGEPLSVAGHLTRLRPTEESGPPDSVLPT